MAFAHATHSWGTRSSGLFASVLRHCVVSGEDFDTTVKHLLVSACVHSTSYLSHGALYLTHARTHARTHTHTTPYHTTDCHVPSKYSSDDHHHVLLLHPQ